VIDSFDPIWETDVYGQGRHFNRYPMDVVVSFVARNRPDGLEPGDVTVLEVGSGAGNNVWYAAREGYRVRAIEASTTAVDFTRSRLADEGLEAEVVVGDFTSLPWDDETVHLAIDRGALTCVGKTAALAALGELRRVLVPGGRLLFNPYSSTHTSAEQSRPGPDGTRVEISAGTLQGVGHLAFWDEAEVRDAAAAGGWTLRQLAHFSQRDADGGDEHSEWRAVLERA